MRVEIGNSVSRVTGLPETVFARLRIFVSQGIESYGTHRVTAAAKLMATRGGVVLVRDAKQVLRPTFAAKGPRPRTLAEAEKLRAARKLLFAGTGFRRQHYIGPRGHLPTGLLYLVEQFAKDRQVKLERLDTRVRPELLFAPGSLLTRHLPFTPYPEQIDAGRAASLACRGIICAPTAFGKSMVVAQIIDRIPVTTLVVVPSLALKEQLTATLREWFGQDRVGPLSYDRGRVRPDYLISVENVDALAGRQTPGVDMVICDEFHHAGAKTYRDLNKKAWDGVYFKFGLTATPFRSNDEERLLLEGVLSKVIYRVKHQDAVEKGYIAPLEAYYVNLPVQDVEATTWAQVYKKLVVENEVRNQVIVKLISSIRNDLGETGLCLVKEVGHGQEIAAAARVPFGCGMEGTAREELAKFNAGAFPWLVGTTGVLGEGVDTRRAEWAILAAGGKAKVQFMQQVGRVLRVFPGKTSGKVILFRDESHKFLLDHFDACVEHLKTEYGVVAEELLVDL